MKSVSCTAIKSLANNFKVEFMHTVINELFIELAVYCVPANALVVYRYDHTVVFREHLLMFAMLLAQQL